jgi:tetratricopeptide (TPR) repeat protein
MACIGKTGSVSLFLITLLLSTQGSAKQESFHTKTPLSFSTVNSAEHKTPSLIFASPASSSKKSPAPSSSKPESKPDKKEEAKTPPLPEEPLIAGLAGNYLSARMARLNNDLEGAAIYTLKGLEKDPSDTFLKRQALLTLIGARRMDDAIKIAEEMVAQSAASSLEKSADKPSEKSVEKTTGKPDHKGKKSADKEKASDGKDTAPPLAYLILNMRDLIQGNGKDVLKRLEGGQRSINTLTDSVVKAWAYEAEGQGEKALQTLSKLTESRRYGFGLSYHLGLLYLALGKHDKALQELEDAATSQGDIPAQAFAMKARIALAGNKPDQALEILKKGFEQTDSHFLLAEKTALEENDPAVLQVLKDKATVKLDKGLSEAMLNIAVIFAREQNYELAQIYGALALYVMPTSPIALFVRAEMMESSGHGENALPLYEELLKDPLYHEQAILRKSFSLTSLDHMDQALEALKTYTQTHKPRPSILIAQADIYRDKEKFQEAAKIYTQALDAELAKPEKDQSPDIWKLYYFRGTCFDRLKDWPQAEKDLVKALQSQPTHPLILNYLGYSWADQGKNLPEALNMLEKAIRGRPGDGYIIDSLGWAHYKLKNYEKALSILEDAIQTAPSDPSIQEHLGDTYWQLGRKREAAFQWNHALSYGNDLTEEEKTRLSHKIASGLTVDTQSPSSSAAHSGGSLKETSP